MELAIVARAALSQLQSKGVSVERAWAGTFLSALDMPGFSISLLFVDDKLMGLIDDPTTAGSWPGTGLVNANPVVTKEAVLKPSIASSSETPTAEGIQVRELAFLAAKAAIAAEDELTHLDSIAGDGDLGSSMKRGGEAILNLTLADFPNPSEGLASIGNALRRAIAGSSGPFYATGLLRASRRLAGIASPSALDWVEAFEMAIKAISTWWCQAGGPHYDRRTSAGRRRATGKSRKWQISEEFVGGGGSCRSEWRGCDQDHEAATGTCQLSRGTCYRPS